jgi:hypothetical protein
MVRPRLVAGLTADTIGDDLGTISAPGGAAEWSDERANLAGHPLLGSLFGLLLTAGGLALTVLSLHNKAFTPYLIAFGGVSCVVAVRLALGTMLRSRLPDQTSAWDLWRIAVFATLFTLGLPVLLVVLATAGGSPSAVIEAFSRQTGGVLWSSLEVLSLLVIPLLLVVGPVYLHARGRAATASSLVSGWLAGFASVLTAVYIVVLRFGEPAQGGLGKLSLEAWCVAAFGVAVLLAPFYRIVIRACLEGGLAAAFDSDRWWSSWRRAFREMRGKPAEAGQKAQASAAPPAADGTGVSGAGQARRAPVQP